MSTTRYLRWRRKTAASLSAPDQMRFEATIRAYRRMMKRCYYPKTQYFKYYGGRGIKVHKVWRNSLRAFIRDMGLMPAGKSLDRRNNNKNYTPQNCRWATPLEQ